MGSDMNLAFTAKAPKALVSARIRDLANDKVIRHACALGAARRTVRVPAQSLRI